MLDSKQRARVAYELKSGRKMKDVKIEISTDTGYRDVTATDLKNPDVVKRAEENIKYGMSTLEAYREAIVSVYDVNYKYVGSRNIDDVLKDVSTKYNKQIDRLIRKGLKDGEYKYEKVDVNNITDEDVEKIASKYHHLYKIDPTKALNKDKIIATTKGGVKGVISRRDAMFRKNFETRALEEYRTQLKNYGADADYVDSLIDIIKSMPTNEISKSMTLLSQSNKGADSGSFVNFFYQSTAQVQIDNVLMAFDIEDDDIIDMMVKKGMSKSKANKILKYNKILFNL